MELLLILLLLLLVTRAGADVAVRLGQPALVGELIAGVLLGLAAAQFPETGEAISEINSDRSFSAILDLAVFFLMLVAGLEMRPADLAGVSRQAVPVAIAGMLVPLALGIGLGWWWLPDSEVKLAQCLFLGVALAITAVPVAIKVLMDLDCLQSETGRIIVSAAVIDDVLSLVLLAVLTSLMTTSEALSAETLLTIIGRVLLFFAVAWALGRYLLPLLGRIMTAFAVAYAEFTTVIVFGLILAVFAEWLHMHFLIGAFTAGLMFTRKVVGGDTFEELKDEFEALTLGFLAPIFFASIGVHLSLSAAIEIPAFVIALLVVAIAGKLIGAGGAALGVGLEPRKALAVGAAMNARGAVEIVIADIALRAGLFDHPQPVPAVVSHLFSAVVIMAIMTTLLSPIMLRPLLKSGGRH